MKKLTTCKICLIIIIAFIISSASSCRKDKAPTYYIPQDLKDYCMFPIGSWWVYEDSISGEKDSIVLMEQEILLVKNSGRKNYFYENLKHEFFSSYDTLLTGESWVTNENMYIYVSGWGTYCSDDNEFSCTSNPYFYYDTLNINNIKYFNIKVFRNVYPEFTYYWSLNIGRIRKEDKINNKIWNLKSYYINN
jgi:hypothetical protein